jgi:hypothetical protein
MKVELRFPDDFDDYYAREVEDKGVFFRAVASSGGREVPVTFYDPVRLAQDIEEEFRSRGSLSIPHLIVLERVTRENMRAAVEALGAEFFE